jgi:hypothetical protein
MSNFEKWLKTFEKSVVLLHNEKLESDNFLYFFYFVSIILYNLILKIYL